MPQPDAMPSSGSLGLYLFKSVKTQELTPPMIGVPIQKSHLELRFSLFIETETFCSRSDSDLCEDC